MDWTLSIETPEFSSLGDIPAVIWEVVRVILGNCDIVIYSKQYMFDPNPGFWHRTPKALGIP